ncbi:MAG TPA: acyltransferase family protein [Nocardioides sp.]|nr:acyltransferase family protein [Nocardioides sp.]
MTTATTTGPASGDSSSATGAAAEGGRGVVGGSGLRTDIEGLRAVAVGTVLVYHASASFLPGGFVGVDVFFVISGFLITSLLLREAERTGSVSLVDFYARRARRLLPAASLVLLVTVVAGWALLPRSAHGDLATDTAAATLYVVNWALASRSVDYLAEGAMPSALQHYWSLSVEEQYYVLWPLLVLAVLLVARRAHRHPRPLLAAAAGSVLVASFVTGVVNTASDPRTAYFVTPTRLWELAIGSVLACLAVEAARLPRWAAEALAAAGLAGIVVSAVVYSSSTAWPGTAAALPTVATAAVIAAGCAARGTGAARVLSLRPLVWVGGLSYAIYLWHWPLLVIGRSVRHLGPLDSLALALASVPLAWLTRRLVEDRVRFHPVLVARPWRALAVGGAAMATCLVAAGALWSVAPRLGDGDGGPGAAALVANPGAERWEVIDRPARVFTREGPLTPDPAVAPEDSPIYYEDGCQRSPGEIDVLPCEYGDLDGTTTVALLGDSKMGQWFSAFEAIARAEGWRMQLRVKSACSFTLEGLESDCAPYARNVLDAFAEDGAPDVAFVSQGSPPDEPGLIEGSVAALEELQAMGTRVVLIADNPSPKFRATYRCVERHPDQYGRCDTPRGNHVDGYGTPTLRLLADELDLPVVDVNRWICPDGPAACPSAIGGVLVLRQGSHLTDTYVRTLTPMLHRELSRLGIARTPVGAIRVDDVPASLH